MSIDPSRWSPVRGASFHRVPAGHIPVAPFLRNTAVALLLSVRGKGLSRRHSLILNTSFVHNRRCVQRFSTKVVSSTRYRESRDTKNCHRWIHIRIGMDWNDPAAAPWLTQWADEARRLLRPSSGERIYANYQSYAGTGSAQAVFGSNHSRLLAPQEQIRPH
jgi:hypothetical protein